MNCPSCGQPLADTTAPCPHCQAAPAAVVAPAAPASTIALAEAAWQQARQAFARYEYASAAAACDKVLELMPAHEEAGHLKAQAEANRQALDAVLQLANGYFNQGQYELALVHFDTALGLCPTDEVTRRKQEMAKLLIGQDLTAYLPRSVRRLTTKWADEAVPSPVRIMILSVLILAGTAYLAYSTYDRMQQRQRAAQRLFQQVERRLAMKEFLAGESLESYQQLTTRYGDTEYARNAQALLAKTMAEKLEETPRLLDQAEAYLEDGQPTLALELARDVLHWDPQNSRAQEIAVRAEEGIAQLESQDDTAATAAAASAAPDLIEQQDHALSPAVERLVQRGQDRFDAGDYASAAFLWEKALAQHGQPHPVLARLVQNTRRLDAQERRRFEAGLARAQALEEARRWPEALAAYREAHAHHPDDTEVAQRIAAIQARMPPSSAAPRHAAQVSAKRRAQMQRWRSEAAAYDQQGQWRQAIGAYRKALAVAHDPSLLLQLQLDQFVEMQERRRARPGDVPSFWHEVALAEAYLVKGQPVHARQMLLSLLPPVLQRRTGQRALILALIGRSYALERADDGAIASYRQSLRTAPVWYVQHSLARALWRKGRYLEAMRLWERAVRSAPHQAGMIAALATGYALLDLPEKAQTLMAPLKTWNAKALRRTQRYPPTVRPDYWLGLTTPRELLADICDEVARTWALLDQPLESLRWRQLAQAERDAQTHAERRAAPPARRAWPWQR